MYGIRMWVQVAFGLLDRQTDGRTDKQQTDRKAFTIPCVVLHAVAQ